MTAPMTWTRDLHQDAWQKVGITITNHLSIGEHVRDVIGKCAQSLYALKLLCNHGMSDSSLKHVYKAVVIFIFIYLRTQHTATSSTK